jgi:hypothetical protein
MHRLSKWILNDHRFYEVEWIEIAAYSSHVEQKTDIK